MNRRFGWESGGQATGMACSGVEWQRPRLAAGPALAALERWVDRRYTTILALWLVTIGAWCVVVSAHKPLSNDEVFVVWSAGQASIPDIWRGLVAGVNQDPPLVHVVAHYLFQLLGRSATVARMPGMAGFLMTLAFCALTVRGRVSPLLSLVPLFLPLAAACTPYATEARPYGWLLGCTSLAVYSWSRIWRSQSPKRWLLLHAMSLAAALASQFFAIYLAIPFACGGAMAAAQRRKSWRPALCATAAALSSVVLWLPIMRGISKYSGHHFSPASISGLRAFYRDIFPDAVLGIGVFLLCLAVARFLNLAEHRRDEVPAGECGSTDAALLIGFLMIPVAALGVGLLITKTLHTRYLLFSLVGWFIGIPMVADAIGGARRSLAASVVAACLAPAGLAMRESARFEYPDRYTLGQIGQIQRMVPDRGETIIPRANLYLTLQYYGEPARKRHLRFLYDVHRGLQLLGYDTIDRGYAELARLNPSYRFEAFDEYMSRATSFYVLGVFPEFTERWFQTYFEGTNIERNLVSQSGAVQLWQVQLHSRPAERDGPSTARR